jgi:TetR/AcrR family transcriptional regulator, transcriptional repressor for nem operon
MNETSKGEKTRERIVAQAAGLFNRRGFEGSSMSDLMAATGLEKGGIYRHFSSKEELAAEAFDYAWKSAFETRMHDLEQVPNSIDKLKRFIMNFIERRSSVPGGCPVLNTAIEADDGNPLLRERARAAWHQWRDALAEIVAAGLKRKEIRPDVDPKAVATLIISSLEEH